MPETLRAPELEQLRAARRSFARCAYARRTEKCYGYDWGGFMRWCARNSLSALPAASETICLYLTHVLLRGRKVSTAARHACAIRHAHLTCGHSDPIDGEASLLLKGAARSRCEALDQKAAFSVPELRDLCGKLEGSPRRKIRNKAILLLGFMTALRRGNLVTLQLADITFEPEGMVVRIGKEKQDQKGKGREIGVPHGKHPETCAVRALEEWLAVRGEEPGPLFTHLTKREPLTDAVVAYIVKQAARSIGLEPQRYGAHSLRAGFVTSAGNANVSHLLIAGQTGHRSHTTLLRYFRRRDLFESNPCMALEL